MNFDHENVDELMPLASEDILRNEPDATPGTCFAEPCR